MAALLGAATQFVTAAARSRKVQIAAATVAVAALLLKASAAQARAKFLASIKAQKPGVVYLYIPPRFLAGTPSWSQWSAKVEAFLRVHKIPYVATYGLALAKLSPTGTVPFISYNGVILADSEEILEFLAARVVGSALDSHLTAEQRQEALAARRILELSASPHVARTTLVDNIEAVKRVSATLMPGPMLAFMLKKYRQATIERLNASGLGDLSDERYQEELSRDFAFLQFLLERSEKAGHPFLFGKVPSSVDCALYACLSKWMATAKAASLPRNSKAFYAAVNNRGFAAFVDRFEAAYFPDLGTLVPTPKGTTVQEFLS